jgi:hypothetical protein
MAIKTPIRPNRSMRAEKVVTLRSRMPVNLVTLQHDVPRYVSKPARPPEQSEEDRPAPEAAESDEQNTTPRGRKVASGSGTTARRSGRPR